MLKRTEYLVPLHASTLYIHSSNAQFFTNLKPDDIARLCSTLDPCLCRLRRSHKPSVLLDSLALRICSCFQIRYTVRLRQYTNQNRPLDFLIACSSRRRVSLDPDLQKCIATIYCRYWCQRVPHRVAPI